jgi:hypothetical protein
MSRLSYTGASLTFGCAWADELGRDDIAQPAQQGQAGGNATLTSEQRTRIQQTVFAGNNVPRVNNVNFTINVGVAVPRSVRVVDVPPTLIEIYPQMAARTNTSWCKMTL